MSSQTTAASDGVDDLLCFSVYSTALAFNRAYKPVLDEMGLTYPQYLVLVALWAEDDQTVGGLGEHLFLESNTLTPLLKRIEALGYIARRRDDRDERIVRVSLTSLGKSLQEREGQIRACITEATGLSKTEFNALHATMLRLRQHLRQQGAAFGQTP